MFVVILVYLNFFVVITSGISDRYHTECRDITKDNILSMCKNPNCVQNSSVQMFCQHVYEKMFRCQKKYLPLRFICDGIQHCQNGIDEDPEVCSQVACEKNFYKCKENTCIDLSKLCNGVNDCQDGFDESPLVCRKLIDNDKVSCPNIFNEKYLVTCYIGYGKLPSVISCLGNLPPDTKAEVICKTPFNSENTSNYQVLKCRHNGTWDKDITNCKPDCGIAKDIKMTPLIINGVLINSTSWPWYAALFTRKNTKWTFFCSSSIISRNMLVTAAHCIWDMYAEDIKTAAGKTLSDFYIQEPGSQISEAETIFMHPLYLDSLGNYGSDIALIKLKDPFSFTEFVLPVCMNWTLRNIVRDTDNSLEGKVVGMGITENGKIADQLRATDVLVIRNKGCLQNQRYEFRKYVTIGTFCAKGVTDSVVCNGDSGSGLAIKSKVTGKWTLEGIVSISPKNPNHALCDQNYFSIYTNVGMYSNWIYEYFSEY